MNLWNLIARIFRLPPTSKMHERALYAFLSKEDAADFNSIDPSGWCPIHRAIASSNGEIAKLLIHKCKGIDLNISSCYNHTPLTFAIWKENLKIVEIFIKAGANVDQEDDKGWTPLTMAISKGNLEITTLLSRNGANLDLLNSRNYTPMTKAIALEKVEVIKHLIHCGADVNFNNAAGWTPLRRAIIIENLEIVSLLIERGADINFFDSMGWTPIIFAINNNSTH